MKRGLWVLALCAAAWAQVKLPPYTREALPNGTVVYLAQKTGLPLVSFHVVVKGGNESEPEGLAGVAQVTAGLLRRGTAQKTADQFNDQLDGLGGTFMSGVNQQATVVSAEFLKKDFDRGLALVADAVLHPAFPDAEVRKALARAADGLKTLKDNPGAAIGEYYDSFFFGAAHPYGRVADEASVDRIRRQDITAYHDRMYVGKNLIVVVAGDFDVAAAKRRVAETFGGAPAGEAYRWAEDHPPVASGGPRVLLVDKPDATQTYFVIAQPGVRRTTPDRVALTLVNTLFGGRFTSMINEELRINSGLTYGASARGDEPADRWALHQLVHEDGDDRAGRRPGAGRFEAAARPGYHGGATGVREGIREGHVSAAAVADGRPDRERAGGDGSIRAGQGRSGRVLRAGRRRDTGAGERGGAEVLRDGQPHVRAAGQRGEDPRRGGEVREADGEDGPAGGVVAALYPGNRRRSSSRVSHTRAAERRTRPL